MTGTLSRQWNRKGTVEDMKMRIIIIAITAICLMATVSWAGEINGAAGTITAVTADEINAADAAEPKESAEAGAAAITESDEAKDMLLYMGHASLRIVTAEGKVIYIDPFAGEGYDLEADLILETHGHYDHTDLEKIGNRNPDCRVITWEDALAGGEYQTFELDYVTIEAVEAGNNQYHNITECVGYVLTLSDGVSIYVSGDTSKTEQMEELAKKEIDYAFFCCDGVFNMDLDEAAECAGLVGAKHNIPYHMMSADAGLFDKDRAEQFDVENLLILEDGEEIELVKDEE